MRLRLKRRNATSVAAVEAQHPAVREFMTASRLAVTTTGALTSREVVAAPASVSIPPPKQVGSEYFEWIDLFEAVIGADDSFTMAELGAGFGRWTVECYQALRIYHGEAVPPHRFIAVEPEPTHFSWLQQHVARNGLSSSATLIEAAVAARDGTEDFCIGAPAEWYGQMLARLPGLAPPESSVKEVRTVSLPTVLRDVDAVDLMTVDIQGAELEVLSSGAGSLSIVNRVSIGTHSPEAEAGLRELFASLGWEKIHDYSRGVNETPWGAIEFHDDGIQTWVNPFWEPAKSRGRVPQTVTRRNVAAEPRPEGGGVESFDTDAAIEINDARLAHLASLNLPLEGRSVLEVGAGVGHLTRFFLDRGCSVVVTEARRENVEELQRRFPAVDARQADVEETLQHLGRFDVVFCYGVLYHLENPLRALRNIAGVCDDLLLIETVVCDSRLAVLRLDDETTSVNQALRGLAHRPSPRYLATALNRIGFDHVYAAADQPAHRDYRFEWLDSLDVSRHGALLRGVFVASRQPLRQPGLVSLLE